MKTPAAMLLLLCAGTVWGQSFADLGFMGGTGVGVLPTSSISPRAQFRVSGTRLATLAGGGGLNIFTVSSGLSTHLEGYFRLVDDQSGRRSALTSFAFGGKLLLPFEVPVVSGAALWGETVTSDNPEDTGLSPDRAVRFGALLLPLQNGVRPSLVLGGVIRSGGVHALVGGGVTVAIGHDLQIGGEIVEGYFGGRSRQGLLTGAVKVLPHVGLQASGGYMRVRDASGWVISLGLAAGSADIDFAPIPAAAKPEFVVPDFDAIEKETKEEKKE